MNRVAKQQSNLASPRNFVNQRRRTRTKKYGVDHPALTVAGCGFVLANGRRQSTSPEKVYIEGVDIVLGFFRFKKKVALASNRSFARRSGRMPQPRKKSGRLINSHPLESLFSFIREVFRKQLVSAIVAVLDLIKVSRRVRNCVNMIAMRNIVRMRCRVWDYVSVAVI